MCGLLIKLYGVLVSEEVTCREDMSILVDAKELESKYVLRLCGSCSASQTIVLSLAFSAQQSTDHLQKYRVQLCLRPEFRSRSRPLDFRAEVNPQ